MWQRPQSRPRSSRPTPQVVVRSRSPWRAALDLVQPIWVQTTREAHRQSREALPGDLPPRRCASLGCSRVRREIPSGRTGRIALSSECSYRFVDCRSRVTASSPSRSGRGARCARRWRVSTHSFAPGTSKRVRQLPTKLQVKPWNWATVTIASQRCFARSASQEEIGGISRSGAGARSSPSVPRAAASVFSS